MYTVSLPTHRKEYTYVRPYGAYMHTHTCVHDGHSSDYEYIYCVYSHPQYLSLTLIQRKFSHGNVIVLESKSSAKHLRIKKNGVVEGLGGRGLLGTHTHKSSHTCIHTS